MKKLIITIAVLLTGFAALNGQICFRAGLNIGQNDFTLGTGSLGSGPLYGFNAGVEANLKITGPLYLNTGIIYSQKGTEFEFINKGNLLIEYIEVPLNAKVKLSLGKLSVFAQGGPYAAYALANKIKYNESGAKDYSIDFGDEEDTMDRFDFGYNVGAGIGFSAIELMVSYGEGFDSVYNPLADFPSTIKNKVLSVSATFEF